VGLTTPHRKTKLVTKPIMKPRNWTDSLDKRSKLKKMNSILHNLFNIISTNTLHKDFFRAPDLSPN
jgi:hypothetical protein